MVFVTVWQMLKKKLILCHVTLNLPVTLVTRKILNITLRNVPVFVPMLMSVAVRGLKFEHEPRINSISKYMHVIAYT